MHKDNINENLSTIHSLQNHIKKLEDEQKKSTKLFDQNLKDMNEQINYLKNELKQREAIINRKDLQITALNNDIKEKNEGMESMQNVIGN